eukprot:7543494-Alexandrium_andersonii.AAC.1
MSGQQHTAIEVHACCSQRLRALALLSPGKLGFTTSTLPAVVLDLLAQGGHRQPAALTSPGAACRELRMRGL